MSRLVGKQQDYSLLIAFLIILGFGITGGLEYIGATNFVSGFGPDRSHITTPQSGEELWDFD